MHHTRARSGASRARPPQCLTATRQHSNTSSPTRERPSRQAEAQRKGGLGLGLAGSDLGLAAEGVANDLGAGHAPRHLQQAPQLHQRCVQPDQLSVLPLLPPHPRPASLPRSRSEGLVAERQ
eukprot:265634-Rhodomonas_salina.1